MTFQYKREPLTLEEEQRLRLACNSHIEIFATVFLLETGLRVSEFTELTLDQVDWQTRLLMIYGKGGENGHNSKRRVIPLSDEAFAVLMKYQVMLERDGRKWCSDRKIQRILKNVANRARIARKVSPHVLRHTFAVACLRKGINSRTLMQLLGHERMATTQKYENIYPEQAIDEFRRKWSKGDRIEYSWEKRKNEE